MSSRRALVDNIVRAIERNRRLSLGLPVPIIRSSVPIGYKVSPDNSNEAIVDTAVFDKLIEARKHLANSSFAEVARWLRESGIDISHNGLHKLMYARPPYRLEEREAHFSTHPKRVQKEASFQI